MSDSTPSAPPKGSRREPRQERSQKRVASILQAAGQLLEEVGYAALTTNAIAQKAGTSIGSLYQFFPNKAAVLARLADGFRTEVSRTLGRVFSLETARRSTIDLVNLFIDGIEEVRRASAICFPPRRRTRRARARRRRNWSARSWGRSTTFSPRRIPTCARTSAACACG